MSKKLSDSLRYFYSAFCESLKGNSASQNTEWLKKKNYIKENFVATNNKLDDSGLKRNHKKSF